MTVISSGLNAYKANSVSLTAPTGASGAVQNATATKASPSITLSNSSKVTLSKVGTVTVAPTPVSVSDAVKAFKDAILADPNATPSPVSIKDSAANLKASLADLETMATAGAITDIALSDAKAPTLGFARSDVPGVLSDATNTDATVKLLQKITSSFVLNVTDVPAADAAGLKAVSKTSSLTLAVKATPDEFVTNLKAIQTLTKAKSLTGVALTGIGSAKPQLSISATDLLANPDALAFIKGGLDITVTDVAAADSAKVIAAADKLLAAADKTNAKATISIKDTAANLATNIKALELLSVAGRIDTITVSDGKALVLTGAQITASSHVLNEGFTGKVSIEAEDVTVADVAGIEAKIEDNTNLTLTKVSVTDKATAIQTGIDGLEAAALAGKATGSAGGHFALANVAVSDKGTLTLAQSKVVADLDALSVLTGPYTLKVTDITVAQALAIKAPSKDATLSLAITDTTTAVAGSIDKLAALVKSKTMASISLSDVTSKALTLTTTQLTANGDTLKLVQGDYKLAVTDVLAKDIPTVAKATKLYSMAIKDTADNVLAGIKTIAPLVTAAKVASVALTDKTAPTLSIDEAFTLKTTLPNVTLPTGIKPIIADTASNLIAHARYDLGDVLSGAGKVILTDKTPPNLTLADAKTLKALTTLDPKTKYNVADGGNVIATQASTANETILSGAAAVYINKNFSIAQAKAVTGIKTLDKGTVYSINDTADNILAQAAVKGETVLAKANAVNVVDTSANILAKLDQLEVLAKAGKIADITFTDTPSGELGLTSAQLLNDAEAIGKIISQRTLPTPVIAPPKVPAPIGPTLPPMKTLTAWSAETTLGTIVDGSYQFRPYMRADRWGNMIADIVTPASTYNSKGQNAVSLYLMAQDGLGNTTAPLKIADFNTSLGAPGTPRSGALYLLKPNVYSASYSPNMVDNHLAVWMEQQPDNSYAMKYLPYSFSPALAAAGSTVSPLATTGSATTLVSGIESGVIGFNWVTNSSGNKFLMEYETLTPGSTDKKDIYVNTFTVGGAGNNVTSTTTNKIVSGSNAGARLLVSGLNSSAITTVYNNPVDASIMFVQETTKSDRSGLLISNLDASNGLVANSDRFLDLGPLASGIKVNALEFGGVSADASVSTPSIQIIAASTTVPAATSADKPVYKLQFFKGDTALSGTAGTANITATDSLTFNNPVKAMWNQASIGNNTTLFAFQDGNVVHAVQVGSDGKVITDDQFAIPEGATFDRYRPLGFTNPTAPYLPLYEFIWREPVSGSTAGETTIKSRIYDGRGTAPLTVTGWNAFNLIAGAAGNDTLFGRGNDVISGGPGNDTIKGLLGGKDVVSYLGKSTDYSITTDVNDMFKVVVKDLRNGSPDGTDTLTNVLALRFADKTVTLLQATPEKALNQNFLAASPGITSASSANARGFIALTGTETGALSVRLLSGNGSPPTNGTALIDAIVNAATPTAFKNAVQAAQSHGASSNPPFMLEIAKTLSTPVDINADGVKETGVRVPLDVNLQSTTVGDVSLTPHSLNNITQQVTLSLSQNFLHLSGGPAYSAWGTSGANSNGISSNSFYFNGTEPGTIKLRMGMNDGTQPITANAFKLATNIATATTPQLFEQAMQDYWSVGNGQFWVDFSMALTNPVDINGDGKNDTNVNVQLCYYNPGPNDTSVTLSPIPQSYSSPLSQPFLKLIPGVANAWGMNGNNGVNGNYTVTSQEAGTLTVWMASNDGGPLPVDYPAKLSAITSASTAGDFSSAITDAKNDNMSVGFYYELKGTADILGNGTQTTNVGFNVNYPQNPDLSSGVISFTPV